MTTDAQRVAAGAARHLARGMASTRWRPLPHQIPPAERFYGWLILAGRGAGKTDACAEYMVQHVKGPPCLPGPTPHWMAIIAPTLGDAATSCYSGPSGIRAHDPSAQMVTVKGGTIVRWPNGSEAKLFGAHTEEETDRLRSGGNRCLAWLEELAAWRYLDDAWAQMRFGLRVGPHPHWIGSTTPKTRPLIKRFHAGQVPNVVVTRGSMYDNPHLAQEVRDALEEEYAGTPMGRQELLGLLIEEDENALWTHAAINATRVRPSDLPDLGRISVGVDPSGGAGEQGIIVAGKSKLALPPVRMPDLPELADAPAQVMTPRHRGFVLDDRTVHLKPEGWGQRAVQAAIDWEADEIFVEVNYGGDMCVSTIASAMEAAGVAIPIRKVRATRGKAIRAQPVSALNYQGAWSHAGTFEALEDQMTTWYPELDWSPDRLDGSVWNAHGLKLVRAQVRGKGSFGGSMGQKQMPMPGRSHLP
jgi:phage terminase large subunit-like protein